MSKLFFKNISQISDIIQEWRKARPNIWKEYIDEYCVKEENINEPFCECVRSKI